MFSTYRDGLHWGGSAASVSGAIKGDPIISSVDTRVLLLSPTVPLIYETREILRVYCRLLFRRCSSFFIYSLFLRWCPYLIHFRPAALKSNRP